MMKLMKLTEWADRMFTPDSRPHVNTLHKWVVKGEIPARKIGNKWLVEVSDGKNSPVSGYEKARTKLIS